MLAFLPLLGFVSILAAVLPFCEHKRLAAIIASAFWGTCVVASTETSGILHLITKPVLACSWIVISIAGAVVAFFNRQSPSLTPRAVGKSLSPALWIQVVAIAGLLFTILLTALFSPPNNTDSMMYHLPRVLEWATNQSVRFYPTPYYLQLTMPPLAEHIMLHLRVLSGTDFTVNLVQWSAFVGCVLGVSYVAFLLGAGRSAQVFAAACCASIPTCVLGASGPKNDLVLCYFLVCSLALMLVWSRHRGWLINFSLGLAVALAVFSKSTAFIYLPLFVLPVLLCVPLDARKRLLSLAAIALVAVIAINGPLWVRNLELAGSPLGFSSPLGEKDWDPKGQHDFRPRNVTVTGVLSNVARNSLLDLGTPIDPLNDFVFRAASRFIRAMGNDPNDRDWIGSAIFNGFNFSPVSISTDESAAGNLLHFLLYATTLIIVASRWRNFPTLVRLLAASAVAAFIAYSAVLRWTPYNARYQMPIFICGAAFVAAALSKLSGQRSGIQTGLAVTLVLGAFPFALANKGRPIVPFALHKQSGSTYPEESIFRLSRDVLYFGEGSMQYAASEIAAAQSVRSGNCRTIGIDTADYTDYPIMAMLLEDGVRRDIRYVGVENLSLRYARPTDPLPCAIICIRCTIDPGKKERYSRLSQRAEVFGQTIVLSDLREVDRSQASNVSLKP